jgi:hypothetical protein
MSPAPEFLELGIPSSTNLLVPGTLVDSVKTRLDATGLPCVARESHTRVYKELNKILRDPRACPVESSRLLL